MGFLVAARAGARFTTPQERSHTSGCVLTSDGRETQWPLPESVISAAGDGFSDTV